MQVISESQRIIINFTKLHKDSAKAKRNCWCIGVKLNVIGTRASRNSEYTLGEVLKIGEHFSIPQEEIMKKLIENFIKDSGFEIENNSDVIDFQNRKKYIDNLANEYATKKLRLIDNTKPILAPDFNMGVQMEFEKWGKRLLMLQVQSGMLDSSDFAKYVDIPEKTLNDYIMKSKPPKGEDLIKLKIRFSKTNFNWLLFGE